MSELNLSEDSDSDREYQIEKILERRVVRRKVEYLIKWEGYSDAHNSWEPAKNIPPVAIQLYEQRLKEDEERRKQSKPEADQRKSPKKNRKPKETPKSNEESPRSAYQDREPEEIRNVTDASGQLKLLMKFRGADEPELVPADEANILWPQMVIAFYEKRISFDGPGADDEPE